MTWRSGGKVVIEAFGKGQIKTSPPALRNFLTVDPVAYEGRIKFRRSLPQLVVLFSGILIDYLIKLFDIVE